MKTLLLSAAALLSVATLRAQFHDNGFGPLDQSKSLPELVKGLSAVTEVSTVAYGGGGMPQKKALTGSEDWSSFSGELHFTGKGLQPIAGVAPEGGFSNIGNGEFSNLTLKVPMSADFQAVLAQLTEAYGAPEEEENWGDTDYIFYGAGCELKASEADPDNYRKYHVIVIWPLEDAVEEMD